MTGEVSFGDAIAMQPAWVQLWVTWLTAIGLAAPLLLLIWRETRVAGAVSLAAMLASGFAVQALYDSLGYVRLLGLPHVIVWTPLAVYLVWLMLRRPVRPFPRGVMIVFVATMAVSLLFDVADVARYVLGETAPY